MDTDISDTIARLDTLGFGEVGHVTLYKGYRKVGTDGVQEVAIEILDRGPTADPDLRYYCKAVAANGKTATGNPASSISEMLAIVHWYQLDEETDG